MLPRLTLLSGRTLPSRLLGPMAVSLCHGSRRLLRTQVHHVRLRQVVRMGDDTPYIVMKKEHQTTGRGGALVRLELHHAITGAKITERFKTSDSLEVIHLRHTQHQFLYLEDNRIHLLDPETYEQVEMDASTISGGEASLALLQDGMPVTVQSLEGVGPLAFSLPDQFSYQVEADDFKGKQGAKGVGQKTVELAGGRLRVRVPEFIKVGEWIIVELPEGKYVGRGKLDAPA